MKDHNNAKPTYAKRIDVLRLLGFKSYIAYLDSWLWAEIRDAVFERDGTKCKLCNKDSAVVHHIDYSETTLRGDSLDSLVSLCHGCHRKIEFTKDGDKRTLLQAMTTYRSICEGRVPNKRKHRCISCNNRAKKNSTHCRPCLKKFQSKVG